MKVYLVRDRFDGAVAFVGSTLAKATEFVNDGREGLRLEIREVEVDAGLGDE